MHRQRFELRLTRRDGVTIPNQPHPVVEVFDINRELEKTVGRHFVLMAAAAERVQVYRHQRVSDFAHWLGNYQIEVWRTDGTFRAPEVVSTSTEGWRSA